MSIEDAFLDAILPPLIASQMTANTVVACASLLAYEYFLTLDREVYYVWGSRWSFGKIIFFVNRYSPIIDTGLELYSLTSAKSQNACPSIFRVTAWTFMAGMFVSEIMPAMRAYVILRGRRSILTFLVCFTLSSFVSAAFLMRRLLNSLTFVQMPPFLESMGIGIACAPMLPSKELSFQFLVFMVNQAVIVALTLFGGMQHYRASRNPMIETMFHDGLLYYIYLLILSIANVTVASAAPVQYGLLLTLPLRVVNSICCTRVLLNIRGVYFDIYEPCRGIGSSKQSSAWGALSGTGETTGMAAVASDTGHQIPAGHGNGNGSV